MLSLPRGNGGGRKHRRGDNEGGGSPRVAITENAVCNILVTWVESAWLKTWEEARWKL